MNQDRPKARTEGLVFQQIEDERLVHNLETGETFCLDLTATRVLASCDGATPVSKLLRRLQEQPAASGLTEDTLWVTLEELRRNRLLEPASLGPTQFEGMSRRAMLKKAGLAAAVAAPAIYCVTAQPLFAQSGAVFCTCAGSSGSFSRDEGCTCVSSLDCCSGICMVNQDASMTCGPPTSNPNLEAGLCCENFTCTCSTRSGVAGRLQDCPCVTSLDCCSGICMTNQDSSMTCGPPTSIPNANAAPCCP